MAYIYALKDRDGAVRYIGKANNPNARLKSHVRDSRRRDTPVYRWIRKNGVPDMEVLTEDIDNWQDEERRIISAYREQGADLLNVAEGGDQPHCPYEIRAKNAKANAKTRESGPNSEINKLKRRLGITRKQGYLKWSTEKRIGEMARSMPHLFPTMIDWGLHYGPTKPV